MNDQEPFYKNIRVMLLVLVILGSIASIATFGLKYGLDLNGGSWLQLQLQGAVAQVDADEGKIIQAEFGRLLNDTSITINEVTSSSVTFTTPKETTKNVIDSFGFGTSSISRGTEGGTKVTLQTNKNSGDTEVSAE